MAHSSVLITRGPVVVYRVRHRAFDTYWGCARRGRAAILMGRDDRYAMRNELYGPTTAFGEIRVAGKWITAIHEQDNDPECGKYGEEGCEGRSTTLVVVNVALGLVVHENVYFPVSETAAWLVSPQGGIAWLEDSLQAGRTPWLCRAGAGRQARLSRAPARDRPHPLELAAPVRDDAHLDGERRSPLGHGLRW